MIPASGICECGCGQETPPLRRSIRGNIKGQPRRFIPGHQFAGTRERHRRAPLVFDPKKRAKWKRHSRHEPQRPFRFTGDPLYAPRILLRRNCIICNKVFSPTRGNKKYCSLKCFRGHRKREIKTYSCLQCKKRWTPHYAINTRPRKFCSKECQKLFMRGKNAPFWRGEQTKDRGSEWKSVSASIRDKDHQKCQVCGLEQQRPKLSIDHIVPFRLCNENVDINLMALCIRNGCHTIKTQAETKLLKGDIVGFLSKLRSSNWPMTRVTAALIHYNYLTPEAAKLWT